jgi:hypothetical protein
MRTMASERRTWPAALQAGERGCRLMSTCTTETASASLVPPQHASPEGQHTLSGSPRLCLRITCRAIHGPTAAAQQQDADGPSTDLDRPHDPHYEDMRRRVALQLHT